MNKNCTAIVNLLLFLFLSTSTDAQLFINEFLAANETSITDEAGDNEDWIEIYNAGTTAVDIAGYYISDDISDPLIWQIPTGSPSLTTVPAGGYLILWADKDTDDGANHIDIKLGAGGEDLILTDSDGVTIIDQLTFGPQSDDISYGRETDGHSNFQFFTSPTPGTENIANNNAPTYTITLNIPIQSGNDDGEEFPNGGVTLLSSDIEMVQDGGSTYTPAFRFTNIGLPTDAIINSAHLQFFADEVQVGPSNLTIHAENSGNAAILQSSNGNISSRTVTAAAASWTPAPWNIIGANGPDQLTPDLTSLVEEVIANPGWEEGNAMVFILTGSGTRTTYSYDSNPERAARLIIEAEIPLPTNPIPSVYINEVAANVTSHVDESGTREDWIEIYNPNPQDIDLGGLYLTDNYSSLDKWQISPGTIVPAGGYLVFFTDKDDEEGPLHTNFNLKAGGEEIALVQLLANGLTIIDSISFDAMPFMASYGREIDGSNNLVHFGQITPDATNNGANLHLPSPVFSLASGSYNSAQSITISAPESGSTIYYTTNGDFPTVNSTLYTGAAININATQSIRAFAVKPGFTNSQPSDATYLINENHNIPLLYITTDPDNFFDDEIGIYVDGTNGVIAYCATSPVNWARDWERPINLKMFETDGSLAFDVEAGVEINGACSRNLAMKSLGISLRAKTYGDEAIEYPLFPERDHEDYQRLKLRNSGQDFIRLGFRDMVNQNMITGKLDIDLQAGRPSLLYINGEFWGIYNIREKYAGEYFEAIYGVNENDLDIIKSPGLPWRDEKQGTDDIYNALFDVVQNSDMSNDADWDYFESQVDVNEMMNYWITMTYMNNYDWPANNLTVWRERAEGAKWRYGMADTDGSTQNNLTSDAEPSFNKFELINDPNISNWPNHSNSTLFLRKALDRQEFRDEFIQRACSIMELLYNENRTNQFIDEMVALYQPNINAHLNKWGDDNAMGGSESSWNEWIDLYKDFYDQRPDFFRQHMNDFYNLDGYFDLSIAFDETSGGDVVVNTNEMEIPYNYVGTYFKNVPFQLTAIAQPGYVFQYWLETGETNPVIQYTSSSNATLTPIFELLDCNNIPAGTPCNDGDICTINDVYDEDCNCAGVFADDDNDTVCNAEDQCPGFDDTIDLNNNGIPDACDINCTDADGDGICEEDDCDDNNSNLPATPGTACDDGNPQTTNDVIQGDACTCQGEIVPPSGDYCDAKGDAPWHEWISGVQLNDLNNTSSKTQYSDFTNLFATVESGSTHEITLTAAYSYTTYSDYFRVWIDYNQNNVFDEPQEIAYSGVISGIPNGTPNASITGLINIPANALLGTTRMRVSMQRGAYAAPCGNFPEGEVEDYSVVINAGNGAVLSLQNCPDDLNVTSNIGQTSVNVNWLLPTVSTTCDPSTINLNQTEGPASGSAFDVGTSTTITYIATDQCGNQETCSFSITIEAPDSGTLSLNCPDNISIDAEFGQDGATVNWTTPSASTTCPSGGLLLVQNGGANNGDFFQIGSHIISYIATDDCGNQEFCSFVIIVNPADNGTINLSCPSDLTLPSNPGQSGTNVNWNEAMGSSTCPNGGLNIVQVGGAPNGSFFSVGTYEILYSATDACGNSEACSFNITVLPDNTGGDYCESEGDFPWHDWISGVQLNTINNISSKASYSDFTNISTSLNTSGTYDIILTATYSWTTFDEYWKVWIDYNQNGTFEEPTEIAFSGVLPAPSNGTPSAFINGIINVPANTLAGSTRMRVAMKRDGTPSPCEVFPFGEVEDYTINIAGSSNGGNPQAYSGQNFGENQFKLFPNPASSNINIILEDNLDVEEIRVFNLTSQTIMLIDGIEDEQVYNFNIKHWLNGIYFVQLKLKDGRRITKRLIVNADY